VVKARISAIPTKVDRLNKSCDPRLEDLESFCMEVVAARE
jgi:hypothetical protein